MWLSLVERSVRDREVVGSNPAIPTTDLKRRAVQRGPPFPFPYLIEVARVLQSLMNALGYGLCHQLPERSLFGGGIQAPVCARDAGIYAGFCISLAILALLHRGERPREFPRPLAWGIFSVALIFMGWDGVTSYAGIRETTNVLRLASGLGVGYAAAAMIAPMLNDTLWRVSSAARVLDPSWRLAVWIISMPVSTAAIWFGGPLAGVAYPLAISASIICTFVSINLVIVCMFPVFDRRAARVRDLAAPILAATGLAVVEIGLAAALRDALTALGSSVA